MNNKILTAVTGGIICAAMLANAASANPIVETPFSFITYEASDLDWSDSEDENSSGVTSLGFTVALGGRLGNLNPGNIWDPYFDSFDLDSNGYVQLLYQGSRSSNYDPTYFGWGSLQELIDEEDSATYLLAAYGDLSSDVYGFYGYKLNFDSVVFYWQTETYTDEGGELLNEFEIILYANGDVRWNFNYANYADYDAEDTDLFTGIYFGNIETTLEATRDEIPAQTSYFHSGHCNLDPGARGSNNWVCATSVPEPASLALFGLGLLGIGFARKRRRTG